MKCLICDSHEASQARAHIFPAWMIASAFDPENRTRDHEIMCAMYPFGTKLPYFGNSVQPEKIKELIGRDLTDKEILEQENYATVINLWCTSCEKKMKLVEDYFLENVDRLIIDFSKANDTEIVELTNANNFLIRLFFYSIFYRAHLANFMRFTLNFKTANKIKYFLYNCLKDNLQSTVASIESSPRKDQILKYPMRCIKIEQKEKEHTGFVYVHDKYNKPYCFILNRYLIQFYGRGDRANFTPKSFFGISSIVTSMNNIKNYKEDVFKIGLINLKLWNEVKKNYVDGIVEILMSSFISMFIKVFRRKFHFIPDKQIISIFLNELLENDLPLAIKYTKVKFFEACNRTLRKLKTLPPTSFV